MVPGAWCVMHGAWCVEGRDEVKNIYFNENLNGYYNQLAAKSRRLKKIRKISDTWIGNWTVRMKFKDNSIRIITHQNDLDEPFPDFVYFE